MKNETQRTHPHISGSFYKLVIKQGSDSMAEQKSLFVPSTSNPLTSQWPATASYKLAVSLLCHSSSAPPAFTTFYLVSSLSQRALLNIQLGLKIQLPKVHATLKQVQSKVMCSQRVISRYSFTQIPCPSSERSQVVFVSVSCYSSHLSSKQFSSK